MGEGTLKFYNSFLQVTILVFTSALVYFAFIYYPKAISTYKNAVLPQKAFVPAAVAQNSSFPIETDTYRVVYEEGSDTYYVFVHGAGLETYVTNKNGADLAIKNGLSVESLCGYNIIYSSTSKLEVPPKYQERPGC